jgi:hypothetical protein
MAILTCTGSAIPGRIPPGHGVSGGQDVNSWIRSLAGISAGLLLAACATPLPPAQPFRAGASPGELIHKDSGFSFPARVGTFARFQGHQYDSQGRDISVGYNGDIPSVVTIYVYPSEGNDLEDALTSQSADVLAAYPGAKVVGRRTVGVTPADISAESVTFAFSAMFFGKQQPLHSELVLARHGDRFIKYRITYPASLADLAGEDSSKFLHRFSWP